jgi:hypothetical protein
MARLVLLGDFQYVIWLYILVVAYSDLVIVDENSASAQAANNQNPPNQY